MGFGLKVCDLCGIIGYDHNFECDDTKDDGKFYCNNEFKCCYRMCFSTEEYVNNCRTIFYDFINIRYISRKIEYGDNECNVLDNIYWICQNINKSKTEEFNKRLDYVNSFSY